MPGPAQPGLLPSWKTRQCRVPQPDGANLSPETAPFVRSPHRDRHPARDTEYVAAPDEISLTTTGSAGSESATDTTTDAAATAGTR